MGHQGLSSNLVINVSRALGGHLLDNVDRVPVVSADFLVMRAIVVLCSPQGDDDVAGLGAGVAAALGAGQGAERQGRRPLLRVLPVPLPDLDEKDDEEDEDEDENDTASPDCSKHGHLGAEESIGWSLGILAILVNRVWHVWKEKRNSERSRTGQSSSWGFLSL